MTRLVWIFDDVACFLRKGSDEAFSTCNIDPPSIHIVEPGKWLQQFPASTNSCYLVISDLKVNEDLTCLALGWNGLHLNIGS